MPLTVEGGRDSYANNSSTKRTTPHQSQDQQGVAVIPCREGTLRSVSNPLNRAVVILQRLNLASIIASNLRPVNADRLRRTPKVAANRLNHIRLRLLRHDYEPAPVEATTICGAMVAAPTT